MVVEEEEDVELDEAEEDVRDVVDDDPDDPRLDSEDLEAILRVYVTYDRTCHLLQASFLTHLCSSSLSQVRMMFCLLRVFCAPGAMVASAVDPT